jgi:PhnB protein
MNANAIQLVPYINFNGDCEEALKMYQSILGGDIQIASRYDNPAMNAPKEFQQKILHATFTFSGNTIMASDIMPNKDMTRGSGDASLSLSVATPEEGEKIFNELSKDGKVHIPFKKQFWGDWHGNFIDKFGIRWMVNAGNS